MVRRRSGGGTVYHDLGNTNYSFHIPREAFDRRTHAELVARALNAPPTGLQLSQSDLARTDIGAYVNGRNDICIRVKQGYDQKSTKKTLKEVDEQGYEERKVSGSAYKLVNKRAYHHGTMLLSASLGSLGSSLRNDRGELLVTKGVASVPAPVANLSDAFPDRKAMLSHDVFVQAVVGEFHRTYPSFSCSTTEGKMVEVDETSLTNPDLNQGRWQLKENFDELQSWQWVFGQTPEFTHRVSVHDASEIDASNSGGWGPFSIEVHSKEGIVLDAKLVDARFDDAALEREVRGLVQGLQGRRYDELALPPPWGPSSSVEQKGGSKQGASVGDKLFKWLRTVL